MVNIARDILKDALDGRCYIPTELFTSKDVKQAFLAEVKQTNKASASEKLAKLDPKYYAAIILDRAAVLYDRSISAINLLPRETRPGLTAAVRIYWGIAQAVKSSPTYPMRARVGTAQRALILFRSIYM